VVHKFEDVETAKRAERTAFNEMVAFLRKGSTCRILLVEKTDRLYRNITDATRNPHEQARLMKTLVSNSTFDRGSLSPTYVKPSTGSVLEAATC